MNIVHVEDDDDLANVFAAAFDELGFHGTLRRAESVSEARATLDRAAEGGEQLDLVISDMNLPDGSGLDVVHSLRNHPVWQQTPVLILSAQTDPDVVRAAYALGANVYVPKGTTSRPLSDVVTALYEHWIRDAVRPRRGATPLLWRSIRARNRASRLFLSLAEQFPDDEEFWLSRALDVTNQANLLTFLQRHADRRAVPQHMLDDLEHEEVSWERRFERIERMRARTADPTRNDAFGWILDLLEIRSEMLIEHFSSLFPEPNVAFEALCESIATHVAATADWIYTHAGSEDLKQRAERLWTVAKGLRAVERQRAGIRPGENHDRTKKPTS